MRRIDITAILIFVLFAGFIYGADSRSTPVSAVYCDGSKVDIYPFSLVTRTDGSTFNCYEVQATPIENGYQYGFEDKDDADYNDLIVELWVTGNNTAAPVAHVRYVSKEASYKHWLYVVYNGVQQLVFKAEEASPGTVFDIPLPIKECADFEIDALPPSREIQQGDSADYTIKLTALKGFASAVNLSVTGMPADAAGSFSLNPVTPGGESTLTVSTLGSTPVGQYTLTIKGEGGGKTHSVQVTLKIAEKPAEADFSIAASPAGQEVTQGGTVNYTVTLTSIKGFSEMVDLSVQGLPNEKLAEFQPASLTPTGQSQLVISTREKTAVGTYPLTITGTSASGKMTHSVQVTLEIKKSPPDFLLEAEPVSRTIYPGQAVDYQIKLTALSDFAKEVQLSIAGLPGGVTAAFQPDSLVPSGESLLTLSTAENAAVGTYVLTITGKAGSKTHSVEITLKLEEKPLEPDFDLNTEPFSRTLFRGESTDYTVSVIGLNDFTQPVALSVTGQPAGTTAAFTVGTVTPTGTSQLQITTSNNTPVGDHTLTITGKGGEKEHSVTIKLSVACRDFSLKINAEPEKGAAPLTVKLTAVISGSSEFSSDDYRYSWNFGDGNTSTLAAPEHIFPAPGNWAVSLTVTDPCGQGKTAAKKIEVEGFEGGISKSFAVTEALPGQEVFFTIETRNDTRFDFNTVMIRDELSPLLEYLEDDAAVSPRRSGQELLWQFPTLKKGETLRIQVKVKVADNAPQGTLTNVAHLFHDSLGPGRQISSNTASLTVNKLDVTLLKQVEQTTAKPGDTIKYQLTVKNNSSIPLTGIQLNDELSRDLEFVSQTQDGNLVFNRQGRYLQWTGTVEAQQQVRIVLKAQASRDLFSGTRIRNQARIQALELKGPIESNTVETMISAEPITTTNVRFTKRSEVPQTEIGRIIRFNLTVANMSDSTLISPVIEDYLPQGFSYVASSTLLNNQVFAEPQGKRRLLWQLPHIDANETLVLRYQVVIGADTRRGRNINRATLRATDNSGQDLFLEDSAFVNVSTTGIIFYSGVEGIVYLDRDEDEFYSMSDTPLENIEVRLSTGEKAFSDSFGHFSFESLFPGEYAVGVNTATLPERYKLASPYPKAVVLADGLTDTVDFAVVLNKKEDPLNARVEGRVFLDRNNNQVYDEGDPLVKTFKAYLDDKTLNLGANGKFIFSRIRAGTHTLAIELGGRSYKKTVQLKEGTNIIDFPLQYSSLRITVTGEK